MKYWITKDQKTNVIGLWKGEKPKAHKMPQGHWVYIKSGDECEELDFAPRSTDISKWKSGNTHYSWGDGNSHFCEEISGENIIDIVNLCLHLPKKLQISDLSVFPADTKWEISGNDLIGNSEKERSRIFISEALLESDQGRWSVTIEQKLSDGTNKLISQWLNI